MRFPRFSALLLASLVAALPLSASESGKPVEYHTVATAAWGDRLNALATIYARRQIDITSQVDGFITEAMMADGQSVEQGATLVSLDSRFPAAQLADASAHLQEEQRRLQELERLRHSNAVSESSLLQQRAAVARATAQKDAQQVTLSYYRLTAPFTGVLGFSELSPGQYVQRGEVLAQLTDPDSLYLDFHLPSHYLSQLALGQPISLQLDAWPGARFDANISSIELSVDPQSRNVRVRASLPKGDSRLRPGLLARITLTLGQSDALVVPTRSVFYRGSQAYVYRVDEQQRARQVPVSLGGSQGESTQVLDGLSQGDQIVASGVSHLSDGSKVQNQTEMTL
ncbi:efflux RND transporter periplasmic adaptor subunit [Ferrimonas marina]|uniref:RND family efflux transporter, MFP subunit n=1 Tax=Ferrimonas marina TaxID=299255 RepID=A0A1M5P757_9GAMM|nr:efflux RND transporter periplasmic adaptor subunit [Ferrimonas marina]SHG97620.1 RND family efflux transporter, MFP subunit [Ferrimonas marina]